ncbi:hypothetical protein RRF57_012512 [Xylaria bambusicola]|uniref:Uncharacterized protein n=1 Tax=Xylaria bambusicola TaxID=326684 RepID=A0AAN7Z4K8_9PEZI
MLRELQRIGQRPIAFDREYSNLTLKFHGAISWNSTLINLVTGTKDRLLEIQRSRNYPQDKRVREREADEVLAKTQAAIPRGKQFTTILRMPSLTPLLLTILLEFV